MAVTTKEVVKNANLLIKANENNNGTGVRNIIRRKNDGRYVLQLERGGVKYVESFKTLRDAIKYKYIVLKKYRSGDKNWNKKNINN
jgi:hypothetical protein